MSGMFMLLGLCHYKNDPLMVNVKFACQLCQSRQPEMRLDYSRACANSHDR
jgi:hypothetical protein